MPISQSLKGGTSVDCGDLLTQKKRSIMLAVQSSKPVKGGQTQITRAQMTGYDSGLFAKGLDYYLVNNTPVCGVINVTDIATYDAGNSWYALNNNYTITACQILNIAVSITLRINVGQTLTNNGTINNASYLRNNGTFNNNGTLNNNLYVYNTDTLNNNGTFNNNTLGNIFNNPPGVFNNTSILNNTGNSYNDPGATINNSGFIYTYGGGTTYNDGILNNTGTISTSNGGTCGAGTLTNNGTINNTGAGTQNTNCPP
jgi:hypothetical protein